MRPPDLYDEARWELQRAIECLERYGHANEMWKAWMILHEPEHATADPNAALHYDDAPELLLLLER